MCVKLASTSLRLRSGNTFSQPFIVHRYSFIVFLNCHSYHSLRYGTISVEQLVEDAHRCGVDTLALTDINCSTGIFDFVKACREYEIKPIAGIDFRVGEKQLYFCIAKNAKGFKELNDFLTYHNLRHLKIPEKPFEFEHAFVIYPFDNAPAKLRDNEYIGIKYTELNRLFRFGNDPVLKRLVIHHPVTFRSSDEHNLHKLLVCVNNNILLSKLNEVRHAGAHEYMIAQEDLLLRFKHYPEIIAHTKKLLEQCSFEFDFKAPKNKKTFTRSRYNDKLLLEQLAYEGMQRRYGQKNIEAQERVNRELDIIDKLGFSAYFLIAWDVVRYSMSRGFYHVGRGSGANSIVAYALYITDVDPIELDLYFERFLNPSRTSPPDFDIDWSWKDRDEILKYIFTRFDKENTAFCGTIGSFKFRSTIRELGKVYGLPKREIDILVETPTLEHEKHSITSAIHHYGAMLKGVPNMRSMHSCGVFITEEPVTTYTALDMLPKGFPTAQIDMYISADISLEKLDVLSQRGIGHINDSVKLIKQNRGIDIDIHDTRTFKKTNAVMSCFQKEEHWVVFTLNPPRCVACCVD